MSEPCCATPGLLPPMPAADAVATRRRARAFDAAARTGTVVTLLALLVMGVAVGGSLGRSTTAERPTVTVTYDR